MAVTSPGLDPVFHAISDATRREVVSLLSQAPRRAGELAEACGVSAPAMSKHLRVLLEAGVVIDARVATDARARVFHLRPESVVALQAWLDQLQAEWNRQLDSFKRHVEERS